MFDSGKRARPIPAMWAGRGGDATWQERHPVHARLADRRGRASPERSLIAEILIG
jgi:hypothetical protein